MNKINIFKFICFYIAFYLWEGFMFGLINYIFDIIPMNTYITGYNIITSLLFCYIIFINQSFGEKMMKYFKIP